MRLAHGLLHDLIDVQNYSLFSTVSVSNYTLFFGRLHFHELVCSIIVIGLTCPHHSYAV